MVESPKFRRKRGSATRAAPMVEPSTPAVAIPDVGQETVAQQIAPSDAPRAEADAAKQAEDKALRKAKFEEFARAEALRRVKAAREQREADARKAREETERLELEAEKARQLEDARQQDETRRAEQAKAERVIKEKRAAAEAAEAARQAEGAFHDEKRRADDDVSAIEARRLAAAQMADLENGLKADPIAPLALTDMVPMAQPNASAYPSEIAVAADRKTGPASTKAAWAALPELTVDKAHLDRNRIITASRDDPAHGAFDVLRTRLLQVLAQNNWRRVAITSAGKDCGKTFSAANLAISLSRQENCRTLLMDLDMRRPSLHKVLGIKNPGSIGDMLRGITPPETQLRRMGDNPINAGRNIAFALNDRVESYASELLQDPRSDQVLRDIEARYDPDIVIADLPPALFYDDVIAARPLFDGVLIVVGGGLTTEKEITEVERRLSDAIPILGMVLNKAEGIDMDRYSY